METFCFLLSDKFVFPLFEAAFLVLFVYAVLRVRGWFVHKTGINATVKRGQESWNLLFNLAFGLASVILIFIIDSTEAMVGYKTLISIVNLAMLLYLALFNGWFRNKIIGIISKSQQMEERF